jgi:DNA polymerase-4
MKLHLDLDCFFVSAHRTLDKDLLGIPVAVGGRSNLSIFDKDKMTRHLSTNSGAFVSSILSSNDDKSYEEYFVDSDKKIRGIITTSSYEARAYGVKTAMSVSEAKALCPHLKVLPPNYPLYHKLSNELKNLLEHEIPLIEQFSIDEFFGDVNGWIKDEDVVKFAKYIQDLILKKLDLPISIGISKSKWIAKLATEFAKPQKIKLIKQEEVDEFIKDLPIKEFPGIGKGYQKKLEGYGILKLGDIKKHKELLYSWKKPGEQLYNRVCGIDDEPVSARGDKKSIGIGRTFDPLFERDELQRRIIILCRHISFLVHKAQVNPLTYSLKIKYQYRIKSKDYVHTNRLFSEKHFKDEILKLFKKIDIHPKHGVVQINITVSNFQDNKKTTLNIFDYEKDLKQLSLTNSMQSLREKFGLDIIKTANEV